MSLIEQIFPSFDKVFSSLMRLELLSGLAFYVGADDRLITAVEALLETSRAYALCRSFHRCEAVRAVNVCEIKSVMRCFKINPFTKAQRSIAGAFFCLERHLGRVVVEREDMLNELYVQVI